MFIISILNQVGGQRTLSFRHSGGWLLIYKGITDTKKASCCHIINQGLAIISLSIIYKMKSYKIVTFSGYPSRLSNWSFFIYRSFVYHVNNILGV
ncbi:MAG TPA: hypothetical protein DCR60_04815 [Psychrobacter sp.]|nr:hypothetical protein [Psychrobacter sp.]